MCGIAGGFTSQVEQGVRALHHRGPDASGLVHVGGLWLGHTRLAILDLDPRSNQPFTYGPITLTYNGELWNYKTLRTELQTEGCIFTTNGDTEVIAAALATWGVDALPRMNGMFAIGWTEDGETLYLARDRFGEVPLHIARQRPFLFASEKKALLAMKVHPDSIGDIEPGQFATVTLKGMRVRAYYDAPCRPIITERSTAAARLYEHIRAGSTERTMSDVPVCTLLSGGIDSAAVAVFLARHIPNLVAYTAVYNPRSQDLRRAREVASLLDIELREVLVPLPTPDDLARVIACIELPAKAQVEIGWACLKLAEQMQADGFKVTFSGEGSDELWASYGFAYHALKTQNWHAYRKDLFLTQARKNFVRCNKVFMAHSIECRLPFLQPPLVEYALSLPQAVVQDGKARPKANIQDAFASVLPPTITRRAKVAFQDGMGLKDAIASVLPSPERFYRAEYATRYS